MSQHIDRLKAEQARLRADRKRVAKELKNASKRKSRLKRKARMLSNEDLLTVLLMRNPGDAEKAKEPDHCSG